jgi:hypothetical protein
MPTCACAASTRATAASAMQCNRLAPRDDFLTREREDYTPVTPDTAVAHGTKLDGLLEARRTLAHGECDARAIGGLWFEAGQIFGYLRFFHVLATRSGGASTAGAARAATAAACLTAVRLAATVGLLFGRQRQVLHNDQDVVAPGKRAYQRPVVAIARPQVIDRRLPAVEEDLDVQDFQWQPFFRRQAPGVFKEAQSQLARPRGGALIVPVRQAQQLAHCRVREEPLVLGCRRTENNAKLQALMATHHDTVPARVGFGRDCAEAAEVAGGAKADQVFRLIHLCAGKAAVGLPGGLRPSARQGHARVLANAATLHYSSVSTSVRGPVEPLHLAGGQAIDAGDYADALRIHEILDLGRAPVNSRAW